MNSLLRHALLLAPTVGCTAAGNATAAIPQIAETLPAGTHAAEGAGQSVFPWSLGQNEGRVQYIHDARGFSVQAPILIRRLGFRANGSVTATWSGGTYADVQILMSTCPVGHAAASRTFAANHGSDLTQAYRGAVTVRPSPGGGGAIPQTDLFVEVTLPTPFLYNPTRGDLTIDYLNAPGAFTGQTTSADEADFGGTRVWSYSRGPTASLVQPRRCQIVRVFYDPAQNLYAHFRADRRSGPSPLTVRFSDASFSSAPGGVRTWLWDFGDGSRSVDRNPVHTYGSCGAYAVTLTVTDGINPASTTRRNDFIRVDPVTARFTASPLDGPAPLPVQFANASTHGTTWLWDFGDGTTSTARNPTRTFTRPGAYTVQLTASNPCFTDTETRAAYVRVRPTGQNCFSTLFAGGNGLTANDAGNMFDLHVKNPAGLKFSGMDVNTRAPLGAPIEVEVFVTADTYVGKDADPTQWVRVATGRGPSSGGSGTDVTSVDIDDFYLAPGRYGVYVVQVRGGIHYSDGVGGNLVFVGPDMDLAFGIAKGSRFGGGTFAPRIWNGALCFQPDDEAGFGGSGIGCKGSSGTVPLLTFSAPPVLGTGFQTLISAMTPIQSAGILLFGTAQARPRDLSSLGMTNGCFLHVDPAAALPFLNQAGRGTIPVTLPMLPSLLGSIVTLQAGITDPGANPFGVAASQGLVARLGR